MTREAESETPDGTEETPEAEQPTETAPETAEPSEPAEEPEADPEFDNPENAETVNSMLVVGDRAMEIVYGNEEMQGKYAQAVNSLASALGSDVKTYSLVTPNSTQFYGPEDLRSGATDQQAIINDIYSKLDPGVTSVDAYSKLRSHIDEYIYFRTDHH